MNESGYFGASEWMTKLRAKIGHPRYIVVRIDNRQLLIVKTVPHVSELFPAVLKVDCLRTISENVPGH